MSVKTASIIIGILFLLTGILGFFENPLVGESDNAIFHADAFHNYVHIGSGVLFLLFAMAAPGVTTGFMILFGLVYLGLGIWGFMKTGEGGMTELLGVLHVNPADNYLHIGLGLLIILLAMVARKAPVTRLA
ncbi:MAG TPA: DUF4383 domain-containing protein [Chitinophagaceae bacterium]|nr:DUF4383 domain-containing protein [Chitinophagaceae bacterium]